MFFLLDVTSDVLGYVGTYRCPSNIHNTDDDNLIINIILLLEIITNGEVI